MRIGKFRLRGIGRKRRYLLRGIGIGFWPSALDSSYDRAPQRREPGREMGTEKGTSHEG
jgi:hypothetical protein